MCHHDYFTRTRTELKGEVLLVAVTEGAETVDIAFTGIWKVFKDAGYDVWGLNQLSGKMTEFKRIPVDPVTPEGTLLVSKDGT